MKIWNFPGAFLSIFQKMARAQTAVNNLDNNEGSPLIEKPPSYSQGVDHISRWQSFSGICAYVCMVGTTYAYSIYSPLLESRLGYSQTDLEIVASVGNTGLYLSLVGGFLFQTVGLHATVLLGACLIFVGK